MYSTCVVGSESQKGMPLEITQCAITSWARGVIVNFCFGSLGDKKMMKIWSSDLDIFWDPMAVNQVLSSEIQMVSAINDRRGNQEQL